MRCKHLHIHTTLHWKLFESIKRYGPRHMHNSREEASPVIPQEPSLSAQDEKQDDEEIWQDESDIQRTLHARTSHVSPLYSFALLIETNILKIPCKWHICKSGLNLPLRKTKIKAWEKTPTRNKRPLKQQETDQTFPTCRFKISFFLDRDNCWPHTER